MNDLTKAEEQVMTYLWELEKGFLKDIVEAFPEPRPAYTTISTVIRVLVKKGFIKYTKFGKVNEYSPAITKHEYSGKQLQRMMGNFFDGSFSNLTSAFTEKSNLDIDELERIKSIVEEKIKEIKKGEE